MTGPQREEARAIADGARVRSRIPPRGGQVRQRTCGIWRQVIHW